MLFEDRLLEAHCNRGYYITHSKGRRGQAPFAYTIGLTIGVGLPELFISGLPRRLSINLLTDMAEFALDGYEIKPGIAYDQFMVGMKCAFGFVHRSFYPYYFSKALSFYLEADQFTVLQCVWPNAVFFGTTHMRIYPQDILISEMPKLEG